MLQKSRREFIRDSARGAGGMMAGAVALPNAVSTKIQSPNDRINIGVIGCGGRGRYLARFFIEQGAQVTCLCDLHQQRIEEVWTFIAELQKQKPKYTQDMQQVFQAKDVDAVVIALPDHWHALATIRACAAGKDVYVEKPHAHNILESRKMVEAKKKYNRIVQVGTQNRSAPYNHAALEYVRSGVLGDIFLVKVYNLKPGEPFYFGDPGTPPPVFDWDRWLGPASDRPYHQDIFRNFGWHQFWDFSGGDLADDAAHQIDLAVMLMQVNVSPGTVSCSGGRLAHKGDDSQVPDLQIVNYDFKDFVMVLEHANYPRYMQKTTATIRRNDEFPYWTQNATRIELYGSELLMIVGRHGGGWISMTSGGKIVDKMYGRPSDEAHVADFLDCVRIRKQPHADVEIIHTSCCMLHMANIAYRVGNRKLYYDSVDGLFDDASANKLLGREYRQGYEL
ncbi:Gfo/Idh/MocA family oxidoreductase [candidate division KSB1 bacterium]|nr:Gfo/Idh/MocA family oxidoreductase [candidate division KSB1 bacterium]